MKRITTRTGIAMGILGLVCGGCVQTTYTDADLAAKEIKSNKAARTQANLDEEVGAAGGQGLEGIEEDREDMSR